MNKIVLAVLLFVLFPVFTAADVPRPRARGTIDDVPPGGGDRGECEIIYYDICSGDTWIWGGWLAGDEVAVYFDLPNDCGSLPGGNCTNEGFNWYWSITEPGRGYLIDYRMYEVEMVEGEPCKVGSPIGEHLSVDPADGWNSYGGLGSTTAPKVMITATWQADGPPHAVTDNPQANLDSLCGSIPLEMHSYYYDFSTGPGDCPTVEFTANHEPTNLLMSAGFSCQEGATEPASWGSVKSLFR